MMLRKYWYWLFLLCCLQTAFASERPMEQVEAKGEKPQQFVDGKDYFSYGSPISVDADPEQKIHILSFFDYDCRVCINTQDILTLYSQIKPNEIMLEEYPVATKETPFSAQVYYSLQQMDLDNLANQLLFESADMKRYTELSQFDNLLKWLGQQGVDIGLFEQIFYSPEIARKVNEAIYRSEKYGVFTYPFVVIDGKYVLTNSTLYNDDYTFAVLDFLVDKLRSHKE